MDEFIINLSVLNIKPTGISNYANNVYPYLKNLNPTLLISQNIENFNCYQVPNNLTPSQGAKGHLDRLLWTQYKLPKIYKQLKSKLLFSPIPEAPLNTKCRYIVTVHDVIPLRFPRPFSPLTPYHRYYIPQVLKKALHIICNSRATAGDIVDFYKIPAHKITPIPLAYDNQHFRPLVNGGDKNKYSNTALASSKEKPKAYPNCPYFLYIGRHDPHKNLERVITAFASLPGSKNYELWLAGPTDPRYTPILQTQAQELGVINQLKFLDYVPYDDLPKIIGNALAMIFPSLWEGFGIPVLESMGCGTPVITSKISSLPEVAGDAGILVNPYSTNEIAQAMLAIITDSDFRNRLSQSGLLRANLFSWQKTGQRTAEVLKQFL
jgi:glycosyltransferase involved in cell wall biosynthesis